jgi:ABC-2 type transport system ATP-binding protein
MVTINFKRVSRIVKKQVMLDDLDLTIEPAMISAICTDQPASVTALFELITGEKADDGQVMLDQLDAYAQRKHLGDLVGCLFADDEGSTRGTVTTFLEHCLKKATGDHLSLEQSLGIAKQLKLIPDSRVADLEPGAKRQLQILSLVVNEPPILLLEQPTSMMNAQQATAIWQLLADYGRKMAATIVFSSPQVAEMQAHANQIIYLSNGHVSQIRPIVTHDSSDCVVKVTGRGLPVEMIDVLGGHFIKETPMNQEFVYSGNIQALLPLLEQSGITDVRILDATIDDELRVW